MTPDLRLRSSDIVVDVHPANGAGIGAIRTTAGKSVLMQTPWTTTSGQPERADGPGPWLERFRGGWHTLLPNAGDGCLDGDVPHGFHGEASIANWRVRDRTESHVDLEAALVHTPLRLTKRISVDASTVRVEEVVENVSDAPQRIIWVHHPVLGGDLLDRPVEIVLDGADAVLDRPDATVGTWPHATTPGNATTDLSRPSMGDAWLAYVGVSSGRAIVRQIDGALAVRLTWDAEVFPTVWVWCELNGTADWPWYRRIRALAVEPASTIPARGLLHAKTNGSRLVEVGSHSSRATSVSFEVLTTVQEGC